LEDVLSKAIARAEGEGVADAELAASGRLLLQAHA
jgi:hypothetical protein